MATAAEIMGDINFAPPHPKKGGEIQNKEGKTGTMKDANTSHRG